MLPKMTSRILIDCVPNTSDNAKFSEPPTIIARFINRNLQSDLAYSKRTAVRRIPKEDFPDPEIKDLYINENLTQE